MNPFEMIFLCLGFACFVLATLGINTNPPRWNLTAAGLAFWILTVILYGFSHMGHV